MGEKRKRKVSAGTLVILTSSLVILGLTFFVLNRLSSGARIDLSRLRPETIQLKDHQRTEKEAENPQEARIQPAAAAVPEMPSVPSVPERRSFTLTAAGTVALTGEVRTNSYYSDVKQYDYYDVMSLLKPELDSDLNVVFLENILSADGKTSDVISNGAAAAMLKAAGFNTAACGFSKVFEKSEEGVQSTRNILEEYGIRPLGIYGNNGSDNITVTDINRIRTAMLQYTETIPAATRKNMNKQGKAQMVPAADPETVASDIAKAREAGAEFVIILLHWGKSGREPDKNQRNLAQQIADAGADLIIGCGSRIVSGAEMLAGTGTGKETLCVWSLGTLLSGDRGNIRRIAGILLHVTVFSEEGRTWVREYGYTPVYTWKYKMDSRFYYRCLPANGTVPDGMDSDQQKQMKKAADAVRNAVKGTLLKEYGIE